MRDLDPDQERKLNDILRAMLDDLAADALRPVEFYQGLAPELGTPIAEFHAGTRLPPRPPSGTQREPTAAADLDPACSMGGETSLGPYRILRRLGQGGQGVVYLAEDTRLGRRIALKVLSEESRLSDEALRRFRREAEITSRLDHPNICTVYEAGTDQGRPFIAMRFVEGVALSKRIETARKARSQDAGLGRAPRWTRALRTLSARTPKGSNPSTGAEISAVLLMFEKVARALHASHEANVVHRDIKPANILVGDRDEPVVVDFGLARRIEHETQPVSVLGDLLGTPHYMSPEQLSLGNDFVDRRTDVYSLGVTLYECLTLNRPFEAPTREALFKAILTAEPPNPRNLNRATPPDLRLVILTAMERDQSRRYRTALDLAEDLRHVRERQPILARPLPPMLRLGRWVRRHRGAGVAGLGVAMAIALAWLLVPARVLVTSHPSRAAIFVNGRATGRTTPDTVTFSPFGRAVIVARLEGYKDASRTVAPHRFRTKTLDLLLARPTGVLSVATVQENLSGAIRREGDGGLVERIGLPVTGWTLPVGRYVLTVEKDMKSRRFPFRIEEDKEATLRVMVEDSLISEIQVPRAFPRTIWTEDLDGDGHEDFVLHTDTDGPPAGITVLAVSGHTDRILWERRFDFRELEVVGLEDADADGTPDVVVRGQRADVLALSGTTGRPIRIESCGSQSTAGVLADINADGVLDVVLGVRDAKGRAAGAWSIVGIDLRTGRWLFHSGSLREHLMMAPVVLDLDGDGHPEICAGTDQGVVLVFDSRNPSTIRREEVGGRGVFLAAAGKGSDGIGDVLLAATLTHLAPAPAPAAELWALSWAGKRMIWRDPESTSEAPTSKVQRIVPWPDGCIGRGCRIVLVLEREVGAMTKEIRVETPHLAGEGTPDPILKPLRFSQEANVEPADLDGDGISELVVMGGDSDSGNREVKHHQISFLAWEGVLELESFRLSHVTHASMAPVSDGKGRKNLAIVVRERAPKPRLALRVYSTGNSAQELWLATTGDAIWSSPAVEDLDRDGIKDVVIGSLDHHLYAFSGADGRQLWKSHLEDQVWSSPALADLDGDGTPDAVVGCLDGSVHAVSGRDGKRLWKFMTGRSVAASPALEDLDDDGVADVTIGSHDGHLYAISGRTGREFFRYPPGPTLVDGTRQTNSFYARAIIVDLDGDGEREIVAGNWNGVVFVISAGDFNTVGRYKTQGPVYSQAAVADLNRDGVMDIVVGSHDGRVHAISGKLILNKRGNAALWSVPVGAKIDSSPVVTLIDADDVKDVVIATSDGTLHALSGVDGTTLWTFKAVDALWPTPVLWELDGDGIQDLVMACDAGIVYVLSGKDGTLLDRFRTGGRIYGTPWVGDLDEDGSPEVVVGSWDHRVYAFHLSPDDYRCSHGATPALVRARRHLTAGRYPQALAALGGIPAGEPLAAFVRARALGQLGNPKDMLDATKESLTGGVRSPRLGALYLLAATRASVSPDPKLMAACVSRDPASFLEALVGEESLWATVDAVRFRSALTATLEAPCGIEEGLSGLNPRLQQRVLKLLLDRRSPPLSPADFAPDPADPAGVDLLIALDVFDRLLAGELSSQEAEARLDRMATAIGKEFVERLGRSRAGGNHDVPSFTEARLREVLHLPHRR